MASMILWQLAEAEAAENARVCAQKAVMDALKHAALQLWDPMDTFPEFDTRQDKIPSVSPTWMRSGSMLPKMPGSAYASYSLKYTSYTPSSSSDPPPQSSVDYAADFTVAPPRHPSTFSSVDQSASVVQKEPKYAAETGFIVDCHGIVCGGTVNIRTRSADNRITYIRATVAKIKALDTSTADSGKLHMLLHVPRDADGELPAIPLFKQPIWVPLDSPLIDCSSRSPMDAV